MAKSCPVCKKSAQEHYAPFCSKRCADIDLGKWLKGSYVIPGASENTVSRETSLSVEDDEV